MVRGEREEPGASRPTKSSSSSPSSGPFGAGSVSIRLYPHNELPADAIVRELCAQAALALGNGFDGVMTSEHHGGFAGYMAQPLQMASFISGGERHRLGGGGTALASPPVHGARCRRGRVAPGASSRPGRARRGRGRPAAGLRGGWRQPGRCHRALQIGAPSAGRHAPRGGAGSARRGPGPARPAGALRSLCSARRYRLPPPFEQPAAAPASSWRGCRPPRDWPA